jgi:phage/plasmid-like protein (TIGR03299 family)
MAHDITIGNNGKAEMAYVGAVPWHGLGNILVPGAGIEEWGIAAGMNWEICRSPVHFQNGTLHEWRDNEVLYRSDNNRPLAIASKKYKAVQPRAVLEFFRDLVAEHGFELETAGTMKGGRRFWALARTGLDGDVVPGDGLRTYLMLVTSCDGNLATTAQFTSIRVVCRNTLEMSLRSCADRIAVKHNTEFDPVRVKQLLGLNATEIYSDFMTRMQRLANKSLSESEASDLIEAAFAKSGSNMAIRHTKGFRTVMQLFKGVGKGSMLDGVAGTAWGLINAVSEYTDHHIRAKDSEYRLNSSWFGAGRELKARALQVIESE